MPTAGERADQSGAGPSLTPHEPWESPYATSGHIPSQRRPVDLPGPQGPPADGVDLGTPSMSHPRPRGRALLAILVTVLTVAGALSGYTLYRAISGKPAEVSVAGRSAGPVAVQAEGKDQSATGTLTPGQCLKMSDLNVLAASSGPLTPTPCSATDLLGRIAFRGNAQASCPPGDYVRVEERGRWTTQAVLCIEPVLGVGQCFRSNPQGNGPGPYVAVPCEPAATAGPLTRMPAQVLADLPGFASAASCPDETTGHLTFSEPAHTLCLMWLIPEQTGQDGADGGVFEQDPAANTDG